MDNEDSVSNLRAYFSGRVQGVGFRYSTVQVAKGYEVTGCVSNLADGRVELFAEGSEDECRLFLKAVVEEMDGYVKKVESSKGVGERAYRRFSIV